MDKESLDDLLNALGFTAWHKSMLPFNLRGWVNALGLYVQERKAGRWTRLQAGGSLRSYLDVWQEDHGDRQVRKFDEETWERRFDRLVMPTYNIADFLFKNSAKQQRLGSEQDTALRRAIEHYEQTQYWRWLPGVAADLKQVSEQMSGLKPARLLEEVAHAERLRVTSEDPGDWQFLALLYDLAGRYKDAEKALETAYSLVCTDFKSVEWMAWHWRTTLGMLYFAAFSNSQHSGEVVVLGSLPSEATPESMGYTAEEVRDLAQRTLGATLADAKRSETKTSDKEMQDIESAIAACASASSPAVGW